MIYMEQMLLTEEKMKISESLLRNLQDLGFFEVRPLLFSIQITDKTVLYRDYRKESPSSYAYFGDKRIDSSAFRQIRAIEKIESLLSATNTLMAFA